MEKRKFRIGELAQRLNVERFVVRFWEKEFSISPTRSSGKQRFYDEKDLDTFKRIKTLLYQEGFTIAGAKKQLQTEGCHKETVLASQKTTMEVLDHNNIQKQFGNFMKKALIFKKKLVKFRELLEQH